MLKYWEEMKMNIVHTFTIDENLRDAIQARQIEMEGLQNLIGFAMSTTQYNIPKEKITEMRKEYNDKLFEYNLLKDEISNIIPKEYQEDKYSWQLDFTEATVSIYEEA